MIAQSSQQRPVMSLAAPAKLNLALDIIGRRPDGYHLLKMIVCSIDLCDTLELSDMGPSDKTSVEIRCNRPDIPVGESNSIYKALMGLSDMCSLSRRLSVSLVKRIPVSAGLGGESTDAASTLIAANSLLSLRLHRHELVELGAKIGADIPFFMWGGLALVEGIGERVTPLAPSCDGLSFLLALPSVSIGTAEVYRRFDACDSFPRPDVERLIEWLERRRGKQVGAEAPIGVFVNALEAVTAVEFPVIQDLKGHMMKLGALGSVMTGHGPTVVGIFEGDVSRGVLDSLSAAFPGCWLRVTAPLTLPVAVD